jgi:dolichol-phosphate mannosyltransferase
MIAVVIPSFGVKKQILSVIERIGPEVDQIYVIDDQCPEGSGTHVQTNCRDPRVEVIFHEVNKGVGGAMITGYRIAAERGATVVIKIDGDGQMDPSLIKQFVHPINSGYADYTKGNRFYSPEFLLKMPKLRLFGNSILSIVNKFQSGYWPIMDPTNGYTAIHVDILKSLALEKINERYFFESDMLFRLGTLRAVVYDVPMLAIYGDEQSNLKIGRVLLDFPLKYLNRMRKRILYQYFIRDMNVGSVQLLAGSLLLGGGFVFGIYRWYVTLQTGILNSTGTIMLAAVPMIIGFQLLLAFLQFDVSNTPRDTLHTRL